MFVIRLAPASIAFLVAGCMTTASPPPAALPVQPVASVQPASPGAAQPQTTTAGRSLPVEALPSAPGARASHALPRVPATSSASSTPAPAFGGTLVSGQNAGVVPSVVDRNRPVAQAVRRPRGDSEGPGTPPPILQPELRDRTGNTLRDRQAVQF